MSTLLQHLQSLNTFQWVVGGTLSLLMIAEVILQLSRLTRPRIGMVRMAFWMAALVAVIWPTLVQRIANQMSIGRGTDFVLYMLALCFPVACFYLLHAIEKQRMQVTQLVRVLAQREPAHVPGLALGPPARREGGTEELGSGGETADG